MACDCLRDRPGEGPELGAYRTVEVTRLDIVGQWWSRRTVVAIRPVAMVSLVGAVPPAAAPASWPVPGLPVGPGPPAATALVVLGPPPTRAPAGTTS
ncbi:MAG TPA: hypothetical protein VFM55_24045 [Micromonosporaceae bacterium]|nr:hypothetical protein [Micromonosporaceae bacterium]